MRIKYSPIIGLKSATPDEIESLKSKYPNGKHITHYFDGRPLPFNGIFKTNLNKC